MKKLSSLILALSIIAGIFAMCGVSAFAEDDILNYLTYEIVDGEVTITDCAESISGDVILPDTIDGYPVKTLGNYAFRDCVNLISITIPDSVTKIGFGVFTYCNSLERINVNENNANYSCDEYGVLFDKKKTELMQYPVGNSRTEYIMPESLKTISRYSFYDCDNIANISIPDSVTTIGDHAFYDCDSIVNVIIPDSVISIGSVATFCSCDSLESVIIGNGVKSVGSDTFRNCQSLEKVIIGNSVTSIGNSAFNWCYSLKSITIPDSVISIGGSTFFYCLKLESVIIGKGLQTIGAMAFDCCTGLENITIPATVTSIGEQSFYNCDSLESIKIYNPECSILDSENTIDNDVTIYGYTDSTAHTYAEKYNRKFVAFDPQACDHLNTEIINVTEADCENDGYTGDVYCKDCEEIISYGETVPAIGHDNNNINPFRNLLNCFVDAFNKFIAFLKSLFFIA